MKINLKYGQRGLMVDLPETPGFAGVLAPRRAPGIPDPDARVRQSLADPILSAPLLNLTAGKKTACIVVSDSTRPVPNRVLLPPILKILEEGGIRKENIVILIATGIHRPNEGAELIHLIGGDIASGYRVENHHSKNTDEMIYVGEIGNGIPVYINKTYYSADLKILTGFIEPHMWAGFSGGRKSILPGISSVKTLEYLHGPDVISHEKTAYGVLEGNPFHEAGLAIMKKAGADFIVNVTLNGDKEITGVFAGDPVKAHLEGCRFQAGRCLHKLAEPLDFILTTNAGSPLDCNLYQATKGITAAADGLKPGGTILIAAACHEGLGSPEYQDILNLVDTPENFLRRLRNREFFIPDQWCAQETYQVMLKNPVWIYTEGIPRSVLEKYHFKYASDVEKTAAEILRQLGSSARWAVIPDGPMLILQVENNGIQ
ncbi:MAG: nickel-dependent lactate racemase [Bacillota bacterium]